jgi:hypothetical protein
MLYVLVNELPNGASFVASNLSVGSLSQLVIFCTQQIIYSLSSAYTEKTKVHIVILSVHAYYDLLDSSVNN